MFLRLIPEVHKQKISQNGDNYTTCGAENDAIQPGSFGRENHYGDFPYEMSRVAK